MRISHRIVEKSSDLHRVCDSSNWEHDDQPGGFGYAVFGQTFSDQFEFLLRNPERICVPGV